MRVCSEWLYNALWIESHRLEMVGFLGVSLPEVCVSLGISHEWLKIWQVHLNNSLKTMAAYLLILDHMMILNRTSINSSLIFGALGFLKHWL